MYGKFQKVHQLVRSVAGAMVLVSGCALVLMACHVTIDVSSRLFFNMPIVGTIEIVSFYYMVAAVVLPAAFLQLTDQHITVDLFYEFFPKWLKFISFVIASALTAVFFGIFSYQSWLDAIKAFNSGEVVMGAASIQIWPSRFLLPASFGLMVIVSLFGIVSACFDPNTIPGYEKANKNDGIRN